MSSLPAAAPRPSVLLARDVVATRLRPEKVIRADGARRGAIVTRGAGGLLRRAEPGPAGPLVLEASAAVAGLLLEVWGPEATPSEAREAALHAAAGWAGLHDDVAAAREMFEAAPALRRMALSLGEIRLSRTPRVSEAFGRSVLEQLVQGVEARRSIAQVAVRAGREVTPGLWHWPTARSLGSTAAPALRRCGVSLRSARALHAGAVDDTRLEAVRDDWDRLDGRLRAIPGVGAWTSAETRLRLGDPDAVSVGDYHLPATVGYALAGPDGDGPGGTWTDAGMLAVLAPYAGQRGRVIRLVELAAHRGLAPRLPRRGPRAALSAHRYW